MITMPHLRAVYFVGWIEPSVRKHIQLPPAHSLGKRKRDDWEESREGDQGIDHVSSDIE